MNRRIGLLCASIALLPACFLFAAESIEAPPDDEPLPTGGSGGEPVDPCAVTVCAAGAPQVLVTDGVTDAPALPLDDVRADCAPDATIGAVTLEFWVRPLRKSEGGASACPTTGRGEGCVAEVDDFDVCGPIATIEDSEGNALVGLRLDGRCLFGDVAPGVTIGPNAGRWTVPAGAWSHLSLAAGPRGVGGADPEVKMGVNAATGDHKTFLGSFQFLGRTVHLGGRSDSGEHLAARFDEVRVWRTVISEGSLRAAFSTTTPTGAIVSHWSFDEPDGAALCDRATGHSIADAGVREAGGPLRKVVPVPGCADGVNGVAPAGQEGLALCAWAPGAETDALEDQPVCGAEHHLCRRDGAVLAALFARPDGPEAVPGCWAIAGTRYARYLHGCTPPTDPYGCGGHDELAQRVADRACEDGCPAGTTRPDTDLLERPEEPERLAIGVACELDRPYATHPSCGTIGLPGLRAPKEIEAHDCSATSRWLRGVACCRD